MMSENRFTIQKASGMYLHLPIFDNDVEMADGDVCILLNEQQDKITELEKNFEDLVEWSTEISKRNVILDEQIGELQRENEQLKKEHKIAIDEMITDYKNLEKENEQLKEKNASLEQRIRDIKYNNGD